MRIDIIGGGSLGLLFGAKLADAGASITVWTRTERQAEMLRRQGIRLLDANGMNEQIVPVRSEWLWGEERYIREGGGRVETASSSPLHWLILAVKQPDIDEELIGQLRRLIAKNEEPVSILCLQNGIGHLERLSDGLEGALVWAAVTTVGAKRLDARSIEHTGHGQLWLSEIAENMQIHYKKIGKSQKMLVEMLETAGFTVLLSNDMNNRIYYKLLVNAVINPLTAIFDVLNGELPQHPRRLALMRSLYDETEKILIHAGMERERDGWQQLLVVCERTSSNISSMLSDVRAGRRSEIAAINGEIIKLAARYGLTAPLNHAVIAMVEAYQPGRGGKE